LAGYRAAGSVELKEPAEAESNLSEPGVGERAQFAKHCRVGNGHEAVQANCRRDAQSGLSEVRILRSDGNICVERRRLNAAGDESDHDVVVRADEFGETDCRPHFCAREVVEWERDEDDFTAGY